MLLNMDFLETSSVCRLCLKISSGGNIQMLDGFTMYMLKLVVPTVNLEISSEPKICKNCAEKLKSTYDFKSACWENHGISQPAFLNKTKPPKEVVCKCCLCDNKDNLKKCKANEIIYLNTMLEKCLSDFDMEKISTICRECLKSVVNLFAFLNCCLDIEDKIKKYVQVKGLNKKGQVSILDIFHANIMVKEEKPEKVAEKNPEKVENPEEAEDDPEPMDVTDYEEWKSDSDMDSEAEVKIEVSENTLKVEELGYCEKPAQAMNGEVETSQRTYKEDKTISRGGSTGEVTVYVKTDAGWKCTRCHFEARRQDNMEEHIAMNHKTQKFKCALCNFESKYERNLTKHKMECHKAAEQRKVHKCNECSYRSMQKIDFIQHMRTKHNKCVNRPIHPPYKCHHCNYRTRSKSWLTMHLKKHSGLHNKPSINSNTTVNLDVHMITPNGNLQFYKCDKCSYETSIQNNFLKHKCPKRSGINCPDCDYTTEDRMDFCKHLMGHELEKAAAPAPKSHQFTNSNFVVQDGLEYKDPLEVTKLQCRWCKYRTKRKFELHCHLINIHKMEKTKALKVLNSMVDSADGEAEEPKVLQKPSVPMFRCPSCIYETKRRYDLSMHLMRKHDMKKTAAQEAILAIVANVT